MITKGQKLADAYKLASMKKFEALATEHAGTSNMPRNYAEQCHAAGAAAIDQILKPWWHRFIPQRFLK